MQNLAPVDHSAMRVNQSVLVILLVVSFLLNWPILVMICCAAMLIGSIVLKRPAYWFVYTLVLKPTGLIKPDVIPDNREPHLFAQGVGGVFLLAASTAFLAGLPVLGWALSWVVTALAALNLFAGFCVGCAMYYWLNHLKVPGFNRQAPQGTFPGMRPQRGKPSSAA